MSLYICNTVAVGLFGIVLSAAFCNIRWDRKNVLWMAAATAAIYLLQAVVYFGIDTTRGQYLYPIHTHLTLAIVLCVLSRQRLWPVISVLTAYLCCQLRRWLALVIVAVLGGGDRMQYIAEMALTVPLLILLLRAAPAVRSVSRYSTAIQCQFGSIPALYYAFDYLTRVYTHLLESGSPVVVEFMPFVCCVAYIIFVVRLSAEQRARTHLEQLQSSLNLQVSQAVREIAGQYGLSQEDSRNLTAVRKALEGRLLEETDRISAAGYDYERMTEYQRRQERAAEAEQQRQHLLGQIVEQVCDIGGLQLD